MTIVSVGQHSFQNLPAAKASKSEQASLSSSDVKEAKKGFDVSRITEVGKKQQTKIAFSSDLSAIVFASIKKKKKNEKNPQIDVSSICMIQQGQMTSKFELARTTPQDVSSSKVKTPADKSKTTDDDYSTYSIYYKDQEANLSLSVIYYSNDTGRTSLDLVFANKPDHSRFLRVVTELMHTNFTTSKAKYQNLDANLLQQCFGQLGKPVNPTDKKNPSPRVNFSELTIILESLLGVTTFKKSPLQSTYKKYCKSLKIKTDPGLDFFQALNFLQNIRTMLSDQAMEVDPIVSLWNNPEDTPLSKAAKAPKSPKKYINAEEFLEFLQTVQNEKKTTLGQVRELFGRLNAQSTLDELCNGSRKTNPNPSDQITKEAFEAYLTSDSNDMFDPIRGQNGTLDMTKPLSSYWINSSHDTFKAGESACDGVYRALARGCRSIELTVYDGEGSNKREPMVCSGLKDSTKTSILDILKTIKTFIRNNSDIYPIILHLENHCTLRVQNKIARYLQDVLGKSLYIPKTLDDPLPSPISMKGKLVVKGKHPTNIKDATVIFDDYDALLISDDQLNVDDSKYDEDEAALPFDPICSIISDAPHLEEESTPEEILQKSKADAKEAKDMARKAEERAYRLEVEAAHAEEYASKLIAKHGRAQEKKTHHEHSDSTNERKVEEITRKLERLAPTPKQNQVQEQNAVKASVSPTATASTFRNKEKARKDRAKKRTEVEDARRNRDEMDKDDDDRSVFPSSIMSFASMFGLVPENKTADNRDRPEPGMSTSFGDDSLVSEGYIPYSMSDGESTMTGVSRVENPGAGDASVAPPVYESAEGNPNTNSGHEDSMAVPQSFKDSLEKTWHITRQRLEQAEAASLKTNEEASIALASLQEASAELTVAESEMQAAKLAEEEAVEVAEEAACKARDNREHADAAENRILTVKDMMERAEEQNNNAETVANTAITEAQFSEQRAIEADARANKATSNAKDAAIRADTETHLEEKYEQEASVMKRTLADANNQVDVAETRKEQAVSALEKIKESIEQMKRSGQSSANIQSKRDLKNYCSEKLSEASTELASAEKIRRHAKRSFEDSERRAKEHASKATAAREQADQFASIAEKLAEHAQEEKDAADLRRVACEKAEVSVKRAEADLSGMKAQLREAERAASEGNEMALHYREEAERLEREVDEATEVWTEKTTVFNATKQEKVQAQAAHFSAQELKNQEDENVDELRKIYEDTTDVYHRAQREANEKKYRNNAERQFELNTIASERRAITLREKANRAKDQASIAVSNAAEKTAAERHALNYRDKKEKVKPISLDLTKMTLINGCKYKYWEKSLTLPYTSLHSITEDRMNKIIIQGPEVWMNWMEYNDDRMTRTFPSGKSRSNGSNYNPLLPWAMGVQLVGMNHQSLAEELWLNDGRFRENGSSGYVLKPNLVTDSGENNWSLKVRVLSGNRIPIPLGMGKSKLRNKLVNLRVRVSVYDAVPGSAHVNSTHYTTKTVKGNCLNPVWNEIEKGCASFKVANPSIAMVMFSVWDHKKEGGVQKKNKTVGRDDDFIAAAAVPFTCLRQGYRSVQLFDRHHTRCAGYNLASLFVNVKIDQSFD